MGAPPAANAADWLTTRERGTIFGIRAFVFLATVFGRWPARLLLRVVIFYYAVFSAAARRASRQYLERIRPLLEPQWQARLRISDGVGFWAIYRHLFRFGEVSLDRIFLVRGKTGALEVQSHGNEHLTRLRDNQQGALLVGAHLGSFEAMRMRGAQREVPINILAYFRNARMINALLHKLNPDAQARVLDIKPGDPSAVLKAGECVDNGELVAVLADRTGLNDKAVEVEFLGAPARFPTGPFLMASILRCPIYLTFGLYDSPRTYRLYCEPFEESLRLPRGKRREEALREVVQRYAQRLEHYVLLAPDNWFNFYDFWAEGPSGTK